MLRYATALSMALTALVAAGCSSAPPITSPPAEAEPFGSVISSESLSDLDPALAPVVGWARTFTYASKSGVNESSTHVAGTLLVPKGAPPVGGWRTVSFGHPATGSLPGCAPTIADLSPVLEPFLRTGFAVVVSDYQGLGNPDPGGGSRKRDSYHPYLDSTTAGYNLIDAARAARALMASSNTTASEDWLAFGIGQGGQAAWAADELAANHGWSLKLIGAVAVSPVADINGLADLAAAGSLSTQQKLDLQAFLAGLKNAYGNDFNLDDYRSGIVQQKWEDLLRCQGQAVSSRAAIADQIGPDDLKPHSAAATETLRGYLKKTSLPQGPALAPMLVMYGGQDPLIPPDWTAAAVDRACRMGDVIESRLLPPDAVPGQFDTAAVLDWMNQRVSGAPAPNNCGVGR
jgi:pimeloyl-ACP methyl ester carboxylesterase